MLPFGGTVKSNKKSATYCLLPRKGAGRILTNAGNTFIDLAALEKRAVSMSYSTISPIAGFIITHEKINAGCSNSISSIPRPFSEGE
jgi:hypothetical protein